MAQDNFTDIDGTALATHDPKWSGSTANAVIRNNTLQVANDWDNFDAVYQDNQPADQSSEVTISNVTVNDKAAVQVRADGAGGGYRALLRGHDGSGFTSVQLQKNGSFLASVSGGPWLTASPITLKLSVAGTASAVLEASVNGSVVGSYTDSTTPLTSGYPGLWMAADGASATRSMDDWTDGIGAADTTAPVLSNGAAAAVSQTQIDGSFDTDTGEGVAYILASANATETVATVKSNGSQQSVTATGTQNFSLTGLTGNTQYYVHVVHTDAATPGNDSAVLNIGPVTTQSATLQLQLSGIASVTGVQFDLLNGPVGSSDTLLISGTFDVAADGSATIDLNSVSVTNGQTLEGIAVHPSTNDPIPLQGTVSIA